MYTKSHDPTSGSFPATPAVTDERQPPRPGSALSFRLATTAAEREAIYRLRYDVYARENGFRAQGPADHRAWEDASDDKSAHLYATADGELVGALRILYGVDAAFPDETSRAYDLGRFYSSVPPEKVAVTSRFALKREYRAGTAALQFFIESARLLRARGVALSFGDSPLNLLPFYNSLGFRTYTTPYHHPVAGALVPFVLVAGDLAHLRQVGSPLLALTDASTPELDDAARRVRDILAGRAPLCGARSDAARFWEDLQAALGPPPFVQGPLAGLTASELRALLGLSYLVDWAGGGTLLRAGHPVTERWLVLSGQVEVDGALVPPWSIIGGSGQPGGTQHDVDARIGESGARLLSLDERKLRQALAADNRVAERLRFAIHTFQIARAAGPK